MHTPQLCLSNLGCCARAQFPWEAIVVALQKAMMDWVGFSSPHFVVYSASCGDASQGFGRRPKPGQPLCRATDGCASGKLTAVRVAEVKSSAFKKPLIARGQGRKQSSLWGIVWPSPQVVHESTQGSAHLGMVRVP